MYREEMRGRVARTPGCARECTLSKTCRHKALGTSGCFTPLETSHRIKLDPQSTWRTSRDWSSLQHQLHVTSQPHLVCQLLQGLALPTSAGLPTD